MPALAARSSPSPVRVTLADFVRLRAAGESLRLAAPRIRVASTGGHLSPYKGRGVELPLVEASLKRLDEASSSSWRHEDASVMALSASKRGKG